MGRKKKRLRDLLPRGQVARNTTASYVAFGSNIIVGLITIPLIIAFLNREEIGIWAIINSVMACVIWLDAGVGFATGRLIADSVIKRDTEDMNSWYSLSTIVLLGQGALIFIVGLVMAPWLMDAFRVSDELRAEAQLLMVATALFFGLRRPMAIYPGVIMAMERYHWIPMGQSVRAWLRLAVLAAGLMSGLRLKAYILAELSTVVFEFVYHRFVIRFGGIQLKMSWSGFDWRRSRRLFSYSSAQGVLALCNTLMMALPAFIVGRYIGLTTVPVVTYTAKIPEMLRSISAKTMQSFYPKIQAAYVREERSKMVALHTRAMKLTLLIFGAGSIGVMAMNRSVVTLLAGHEFYGGTTLTFLIIIYGLLSLVLNCGIRMFHAVGDLRKLWLVSILEVLAAVGLSVILLPYYGMHGVFIAGITATLFFKGFYVIIVGCRLWGVPVKEFIDEHWRDLAIVLVCLSCCCLVLSMSGERLEVFPSISEMGIVVLLAIVTLVYGTLVYKRKQRKSNVA